MLNALKASQSATLRSSSSATAASASSCCFSTSAVTLVNAKRKAAARAAGRFKSNAPQRQALMRKNAPRGVPPHRYVTAAGSSHRSAAGSSSRYAAPRGSERTSADLRRHSRQDEDEEEEMEEEEEEEDEPYDPDAVSFAPARHRFVQPVGQLTRRQELEKNERIVRKQLASLASRLSDADQRETSQRAEAELPPLDEDELQVLYDALQLPEPADAETKRLAARERKLLAPPPWQERLLKGVEQARTLLPSPRSNVVSPWQTTTHRERLDARLNTLVQRLADLDVGVGTSAAAAQDAEALNEQRVDLAQRVAALLAGKRHLSRQAAEERLAAATPEPVSKSLEFESVDLAVRAQRTAAPQVQQDPAATLFSSADARNGVMDRIEAFLDSMPAAEGKEAEQVPSLPTGFITGPEWRALAVACAHEKDDISLDRLVRLMIRSGSSRDIGLFNEVMDVYAQQGDVERCSNALAVLKAANMQPTDHTYHCIVKSHLQAGQPDRALTILNSLEDESPAGMATYTMVLQALLQLPEAARPTFWSLFYRMRMVAHPVPDAPLYAVAIRACASGVPNPGDKARGGADAERALDLFREMTTRHSVRPTAETYNALTLALSQRADTLLQAFSMLREMVELEQKRIRAIMINPEAEENKDLTCFAPDRRTYNALLRGCSRAGDLSRARWVLAEMLRNASALWEEGTAGRGLSIHDRMEIEARRPDASTLMYVFHAYASFKPQTPPIKNKLQVAADTESSEEAAAAGAEEASEEELEVAPRVEEAAQSFTPEVPATSADVVAEARGLFSRILADQEAAPEGALFSNIRPSPQLIHAYLSVLAVHLPPDQVLPAIRQAFLGNKEGEPSLFEKLNVKPNGHTFLLILDTCAAAVRSQRDQADALAKQTWQMWRLFEARHFLTRRTPKAATPVDVLDPRTLKQPASFAEMTTRTETEIGLDERTIQRVWAAMIRNYAKSDKLDEAMATLREFVTLYPPPKRPDFPGAKVPLSSLLGPVTGATLHRAVAYAPKPSPRLQFHDVALLHQRLVATESRKSDLAYLAWATRTYTASARTKRASLPVRPNERLLRDVMMGTVKQSKLKLAGLHLSPATAFAVSEKVV